MQSSGFLTKLLNSLPFSEFLNHLLLGQDTYLFNTTSSLSSAEAPVMRRSIWKFNIPPGQPPGHLNFWRLACSNSLPSGQESRLNAPPVSTELPLLKDKCQNTRCFYIRNLKCFKDQQTSPITRIAKFCLNTNHTLLRTSSDPV